MGNRSGFRVNGGCMASLKVLIYFSQYVFISPRVVERSEPNGE